jgi:AraC-like DNA-binding protein
MPGSTLSVFGEPDDFQAALKEDGCVDLLVTGQGKFRAQYSLIALRNMRLALGDERQSRVAFVSIPSRFTRVTLPTRSLESLICSGIAIEPHQIITHSTGHRFHERINGSCRWGTMSILTQDLATAGYVISGNPFALPAGESRWHPAPDAFTSLISLHRNAMAATANSPGLPADEQAARGLKQQLLTALIECLAGQPMDHSDPTRRRSVEIMAGFEDEILTSSAVRTPLAEICLGLGVSEHTLRRCCRDHLGMGPSRYLYLRRMRLANRALRDADHPGNSVGEIVRLHGFDNRGSFPRAYRAIFGEAPSETLKRRIEN